MASGPRWRLIALMQAAGQAQMALDEYLLEQHRLGQHPPMLRFYQWQPAAISLGYHQRHYPEAWHSLEWQGRSLDIVRRPTGGRAVLHQGDLTYALVTSGYQGNRRQVYRQLSAFLVEGWRSLGIPLYYGQSGRGYIHNPDCFGTATDADLVTATGYKLIGSAQLYRGHAVLQHGSIRLTQDAGLYHQVFGRDPGQSPFTEAASDGSDDLIERVIWALAQAARECFDVEFEEVSWPPQDLENPSS